MKIRSFKEENRFNVEYLTKEYILTKAHKSDSGFDIRANVSSDVILKPDEFKLIDTGIKMEIPIGCEAQIRPRSGLAVKHGITVLNAPGTIDAGYRGEIKVILINHGKEEFRVRKGDIIAQIVFAKILNVETIKVNSIREETERKEKGFGSTDMEYNRNMDVNTSRKRTRRKN